MKKIPVIAVVGPTASGKTAMAVEIARKFSGEVVSADSMQIYKNMNIATAKPTADEMKGIKHHLIGFQPVNEKFSVARYTQMASACIRDIYNRGKLPVIAGGTGLYVDSLLENVRFSKEENDGSVRRELTALFDEKGGEYMLGVLSQVDEQTASRLHPNDKSRIIRAIEIYRLTGKTMSQHNAESKNGGSPYEALYIGINYRDRARLYDRINRRVDIMLENGLLDEAREFYSADNGLTSVQAIGYKELAPWFEGGETLENCVENLKMQTRRYAKRQLTWFNKNPEIHWFYPDDYKSSEELYGDVFKTAKEFLRRRGDEENE